MGGFELSQDFAQKDIQNRDVENAWEELRKRIPHRDLDD